MTESEREPESKAAAPATRGARAPSAMVQAWMALSPKLLPFADAASANLPLGKLLRLSLFQVSVGLAAALLSGALNRVMIVELGVSAWLVSAMIAVPLLLAPARAFIGHRSDTHRSLLGWRRVPYLWIGSMIQFGGFAIMPFALLLLSGDSQGGAPDWLGPAAAGFAFLLVGLGVHVTQTAGLALAADVSPPEARPRVVALLYVMLLLGMGVSALALGWLLRDFSQLRLIQVIQGAAVVTLLLNLIALWRQEPRSRERRPKSAPTPSFWEAWRSFEAAGAVDGQVRRLLIVVGLGTAAFAMQDVLLEPYGGRALGMSVAETTWLTAFLAAGMLAGFAVAARGLSRGEDAYRLAAFGATTGIPGFSAIVFAAPLGSAALLEGGALLVGFGAGLFSVGALSAIMALSGRDGAGLAMGAWGAVQAAATGGGILLGGIIRDAADAASTDPTFGFIIVYHIEIFLLFITLAALGPLARYENRRKAAAGKFGLADIPT